MLPEEEDNIDADHANLQSTWRTCEARTSAESSENIAAAVRPPPRENNLNSLAARKHKNISPEKEAARMDKETEKMLKKTADVGSKCPRRSKRLSSTKERVVINSSQSASNLNEEEEETRPTKTAKEGKKTEKAAAIRKSSRNTKHPAEHDDNEENNEVNMSIFLLLWMQNQCIYFFVKSFV